jgi:hypothetical protein
LQHPAIWKWKVKSTDPVRPPTQIRECLHLHRKERQTNWDDIRK